MQPHRDGETVTRVVDGWRQQRVEGQRHLGAGGQLERHIEHTVGGVNRERRAFFHPADILLVVCETEGA